MRLVSICIAIALVSPRARGEADEQDKTVARDLFDAGVKKMEKGKCDETPVADVPLCLAARDDFRRSFELSPSGLGALRNLAYVEKGLGLVASAARSFRELERRAPLDPKPARQLWAEWAKKELVLLEPRIPRLQLVLPVDRPAGTKVLLDDKPLSEAAWGSKLDVDPGDHTVDATAPGRKSFHAVRKIPEGSLEIVKVELTTETSEPPSKPKPELQKPVETAPSRALPLVVSGMGVVGVGVGLALGWAAISKHGKVCDAQNVCEPEGLEKGRSLANASTVVTAVSAAVLVGGIVWYALVPTSAKADRAAMVVPYADPRGAGLFATVRF